MRKQILAILIAIGMTCAFAPMVGAASFDVITVTLTPGGTVDIDVSPNTWAGEGAILGETKYSTNTTFDINNTGTAQVLVNISAAMVGGMTWTLDENGAPAHNTVSLMYQKKDAATWTYITGTPTTFIAALPAPAGQDKVQFGLGVEMPPSSTRNTAQGVTITFTATAT